MVVMKRVVVVVEVGSSLLELVMERNEDEETDKYDDDEAEAVSAFSVKEELLLKSADGSRFGLVELLTPVMTGKVGDILEEEGDGVGAGMASWLETWSSGDTGMAETEGTRCGNEDEPGTRSWPAKSGVGMGYVSGVESESCSGLGTGKLSSGGAAGVGAASLVLKLKVSVRPSTGSTTTVAGVP